MKAHPLAMLLVAVSLTAGCRQDPYVSAHIEVLNAAKRSLEDRVYELEDEYDVQTRALKKLRDENDRLRRSGSTGSTEPRRNGIDLAPPRIEMPGVRDEELKPPVIEEGVPMKVPPDSSRSSSRISDSASPTTARSTPPSDAAIPSPGSPTVTGIQFDRERTGGRDWDQQPGDDGLCVVIQPRNSEQACLPVAGAMAVVVLDPSEEGEGKRIARWDLDASQVARCIRNSPDEQGIYLDLPWPSNKPPHNARLHLFVRYLTPDGRPLEADQAITIVPPGQPAQSWIMRSRSAADSATDGAPVNTARPKWSPFRQ